MTLRIKPLTIEITDKDNNNEITLTWIDDGVVEMTLGGCFMLDEATIDELTPVLKEAFKELMK